MREAHEAAIWCRKGAFDVRQWLGDEWRRTWLFWLVCGWTLLLLLACVPGLCAAQEFVASSGETGHVERAPEAAEAGMALGTVSGVIVDNTEAAVPGATVTLWNDSSASTLQMASLDDGSFLLEKVPAGSYHVRVEREGFSAWDGAASVTAGGTLRLEPISLPSPVMRAAVTVHASLRDVAEAQMEQEEHQRVLGVFPNFYATYAADPEPLSAGQKMRLAWRFSTDPTSFAMAGVIAGAQQGGGSFSGYGGGPQGFIRRLGATYADGLTSTMIGQAALPILFRQDPRYFVKGTGSIPARTMYALASTVICKGDDRRWQVNYSNILGNLFSAGLSNSYYPANQRGAGLLVQNGLLSTALGAVGGLFQEFVLRRMTPMPAGY